MKKLILITILTIGGMNLLLAQTSIPPVGDGSYGNPYQIATLENLYWLSQNPGYWAKSYIQTADIDASSTSTWDGGLGFSPIGTYDTPFTGSYNGQGHTINGLFILRSLLHYVGLFGHTDRSIITDLGLTNVNITGSGIVGSLAGHNCQQSIITLCYATGIVTAGYSVGGLVGTNNAASTIRDCYAKCRISGTHFSTGQVGGLLGVNVNSSVVHNCYATGIPSGASDIGGLVGRNSNPSTVVSSFYDSQTSGMNDTGKGTPKTTDEMKTTSTFTSAGWNFENDIANGSCIYWDIDNSINNGYPYLNHLYLYHVDEDATGDNSGTSWANAFNYLQDALSSATSDDEIWVAEGTYYPDEGNNQTDNLRTSTFCMKNGVGIYGGFAGTETSRSERNVSDNVTTLSGDLDQSGTQNDNDAYHVFYHPSGTGLNSTAVLDGFTITGGNASGSDPHNNGGGMVNNACSPTVTNCTFSGNSATQHAGGLYNSNGSATSINSSTFSGNTAVNGGGITNSTSANTSMTNCVFINNTASGHGGGTYNNGSSPAIINCTFSGNSAADGDGLYNESSSNPVIKNCILWGSDDQITNASSTPVVTYSDVQQATGTYSGTGNLNTNPLFSNELHLSNFSPCIGTGTSYGAPATDIEGTTRGASPDMGAYENSLDTPSDLTRFYVDKDATGTNNGTSWADASTTLQDVLSLATSGDEIWVAAGTYYPDAGSGQTNNLRTSAFCMKNGVGIYGGFDGSETSRDQRDPAANLTILSGDLDQSGSKNSQDAYHVFYHPAETALNSTAVLDGFTITGGNANGSNPHNNGGGMVNNACNPTVISCTFSGNTAVNGGGLYNDGCSPTLTNCSCSQNSASEGGGIYNTLSSPTLTGCTISSNISANSAGGIYNTNISNPVLTGCTISENTAGTYGGGMHNNGSSPTINNCDISDNSSSYWAGGIFNYNSSVPQITNTTFSGNTATENGGAIINNQNSHISLTNCVFSGNSATNDGGGIVNRNYSLPTIINCTFSNNTAARGDAIRNEYNCSPTIKNSILWGSDDQISIDITAPVVTYCDVQQASGVYSGTGNINVDPSFVNGLHLADNSLCIGAGTSDGAPNSDIEGNTRGNPPDLGAYENYSVTTLFVKADASGANNGHSWVDAFTSLQDALAASTSGKEIWVAAGTYYPDEGSGQTNNLRTSAFCMKNGVGIYGGFAGTETSRSERNVSSNATTLSGDLDQSGDINDNDAYHVFYHPFGTGLDNTAILDGFTITGGNANGGGPASYGGGMNNTSTSPTVTNCTFSGNTAQYGGGVFNSTSSASITNCVFTNNSVSAGGAGMWNTESSTPTLTNCTFSSNALGNYSSTPVVKNCILWGSNDQINNLSGSTPVVTYSDVQQASGVYSGEGNINSNPQFTSGLHLADNSPCIGAGTSSGAPSEDIEGITRGASPDMGAYENTRDNPTPSVQLSVKVFLEGSYNTSTDEMNINLRTAGAIPTTSPYSDGHIVNPIPSNIVDWVYVEIRSTTTEITSARSAFLHKDGRIMDDDGTTNFILMSGAAGNYYIVVKHRNHLSVMSDNPHTLSAGSSTLYDFTTGDPNALAKYEGGEAAELETGIYGMFCGDADGSSTVDANDRSAAWNNRNTSGYLTSDCCLSGTCDANSRSACWNNRNKSTNVP